MKLLWFVGKNCGNFIFFKAKILVKRKREPSNGQGTEELGWLYGREGSL